MIGREIGADRVGAYSPVVLTRILKRTASEGRSGALHVVSGPSAKMVHFEKGSVRFAASNMRRDRLGESMLAHDSISKGDYELATERMRAERCRFGEALIQLGRLDEEQLNRELAIQVQRIVLSLFRISEGTYSYEESSTDSKTSLPFVLSVPPLLLKGLRAVEDGKLILSALPPADTRVRATSPPPFRIDPKKLSESERCVLEIAGEGAAIGDIIRTCEQGRSTAFRSCFALLSVGLLEEVPGVAPAEAESPARRESEEPCRSRILEQYEKLGAVGEHDLLGVGASASNEALRIAYAALKSEWDKVRSQTADPELVEKLDAIEFRLAAAYTQLQIEHDRQLEAQTKKTPSPTDFSRRQRIEQLERDARLHLQVKDWNGAVSLVQELIALEPGRAEFHSMMGKAKQHLPSMRKNAEQHFLEAVLLAPDDVSLRLDAARYYLAIRSRSRALVEIHSVLALEPGNEEAHRLSGSLRKRTPMQKLLRKVFG